MTRRDHFGLQNVGFRWLRNWATLFLALFFRRGLAHYSAAVCSDVFLFHRGKRNASQNPVSVQLPEHNLAAIEKGC